MEFSIFFFHLLFLGLIFQLSNTIVSSTKFEIPAQNEPTDKLNSLIEQMDEKDANIGKRLVQQRIKRDMDDTDEDTAYETAYETAYDTAYDTSHDTDDDAVDGPISEDVVYIDLRQSGCLGEIRDQGDCNASYAFATIAFYEWLFCKKTRRFMAFSEQYIINCGHLRGNNGCDGGDHATAISFSRDCGLLLQQEYPYTGVQEDCPYQDSIPYREMGTLRINQPSATHIPLNRLSLEEHLMYGPVILALETSRRFFSYAGGVDNNVGHSPNNMQTMLLIGHGREDGQDYWLFRNSHSNTFGGNELGHYKLNKDARCFWGAYGIGLSGPLSG